MKYLGSCLDCMEKPLLKEEKKINFFINEQGLPDEMNEHDDTGEPIIAYCGMPGDGLFWEGFQGQLV